MYFVIGNILTEVEGNINKLNVRAHYYGRGA